MSSNTTSTETLCDTCVHKVVASEGKLMFCKLLEEELLRGKLECEDWEEDTQSEDNQHECET